MGENLEMGLELDAQNPEKRMEAAKRACLELHARFSALQAFTLGLMPARHEAKIAITNLEAAYYTAIIGMVREYNLGTDFIKNL